MMVDSGYKFNLNKYFKLLCFQSSLQSLFCASFAGKVLLKGYEMRITSF